MMIINKPNFNNIKSGDILIYSSHKAYLIIQTDIEYLALQIFNNGNEDLGNIRYYDSDCSKLLKGLFADFGYPILKTSLDNITITDLGI